MYLYNISPKYSLIRAHDESYLWRNIQKKLVQRIMSLKEHKMELVQSSFSNF